MISVVVCTFNRKALLGEMLKSFFDQEFPDHIDFELIVVDNHSTDGTHSIVKDFSAHNTIRYIFEEKQGLSVARNRGIRESYGGIISFLDDDVIVDKQWITAIQRCFEESGADVVGGRSYLLFRCDRPTWLEGSFRINLSEVNLGEERKEVDQGRGLFGLNISFRRSIFETYGYFNEAVGRKGGTLLSGEETALLGAISQAGGKIVYEPKAKVGHVIEPDRVQWDYFKRLAYNEGLSNALIERPRYQWVQFLRIIRAFQKMAAAYLRAVGLKCIGMREYVIKDTVRRGIIWRGFLIGRWSRFIRANRLKNNEVGIGDC